MTLTYGFEVWQRKPIHKKGVIYCMSVFIAHRWMKHEAYILWRINCNIGNKMRVLTYRL